MLSASILEKTDTYVQFMTILIIFLFVLFLTWAVTKWIAGYQKSAGTNTNMEIIETFRLANNKYIHLVRVGEKYLAVAICKDSVTMLTEVPKEELCLPDGTTKTSGFKDILARVQQRGFQDKEDGEKNE